MMNETNARHDPRAMLNILADLSARLNSSDELETSGPELMRLLCLACGADGAALYARHYDRDGGFSLVRTCRHGGAATDPDPLPAHYVRTSLTPELWETLTCPKPSRHGLIELKVKGEDGRSHFYPLHLDTKPYGFLQLTGIPAPDGADLASFLTTAATCFEAWLSRSNVKKRFRDVFDSFPNPSFIMETNERITFWNSANEKLTGWKAERIVDRDDYTSSLPYYAVRRPMVANLIMRPDPQWQSTYLEFVRESDHVNALAFCPALPGGGGYLRTNTTRLYDINRRLWGAIHSVRDVTLERKMRENLKRSESMYKSITDFAGVGILLVRDNEIIYANEQAEEFLGHPTRELSLHEFLSWIQPTDSGAVSELIANLQADKEKPVRFEFQASGKGELRYFNALAQMISYESEDLIHLVIDDISEQKELDRRARLNELKLMHEERLTSLGTMAAGIAHELNQPLNTIRVITDGFLYCDEKGWGMDRDELIDNVEMISKQVTRMSTVIQNIRNFAREDQGKEFSEVSINEAVDNVFSMIGTQLEAHDIRVTKSLGRDIPVIIAPLNQMEQVVTNLLINARQAFDSCGHGECHIWLKTEARDGSVLLSVSDNATGIPNDLLEKIFYPFFTTKQVGKGTGLGLSICRTIVASMKGNLEARNNDRGGATFTVTIPVQER